MGRQKYTFIVYSESPLLSPSSFFTMSSSDAQSLGGLGRKMVLEVWQLEAHSPAADCCRRF